MSRKFWEKLFGISFIATIIGTITTVFNAVSLTPFENRPWFTAIGVSLCLNGAAFCCIYLSVIEVCDRTIRKIKFKETPQVAKTFANIKQLHEDWNDSQVIVRAIVCYERLLIAAAHGEVIIRGDDGTEVVFDPVEISS